MYNQQNIDLDLVKLFLIISVIWSFWFNAERF